MTNCLIGPQFKKQRSDIKQIISDIKSIALPNLIIILTYFSTTPLMNLYAEIYFPKLIVIKSNLNNIAKGKLEIIFLFSV